MKFFRVVLILAILLAIAYLMGPTPDTPVFKKSLPAVKDTGRVLQDWVMHKEARVRLKPDNQARIIWANDSLKTRTPYAIVYLHGFSASQKEGDPVHLDFAKRYGCNMYLSRLDGHGVDSPEALASMTAESLWESAKEAYAIGKQLGDKVILMGTSTGGTLALMLAAHYPEVSSLILMSPNIAINDPNAFLLNNHWGLQLARLVKKSNYIEPIDKRPDALQYWSAPYRLEAAVQVEELLEDNMIPATFASIKQPTLMLYYYKDNEHQDPVVKVSAMKEMFTALGTPVAQKREVAIPNAGDHVIGSALKSKDVPTVEAEIFRYAEGVLGLKPVVPAHPH
jgi:pimeloyl-ACP methyl ester carboxylesterase